MVFLSLKLQKFGIITISFKQTIYIKRKSVLYWILVLSVIFMEYSKESMAEAGINKFNFAYGGAKLVLFVFNTSTFVPRIC